MTGVLLMAYGTPATLDDVEAYYTHIRGGRTPAPELIADLRRRYEAIGGTSPLLAITRAQVAAVQRALGDGFRVELGMKHASPFIEEGVAALAAATISDAVGVVLTPHYSSLSVGDYQRLASAAAARAGINLALVDNWHLETGYIEFLSHALRATTGYVLFTAHSLPARILDTGDPYPDQLRESAEAIAKLAGLDDDRWSLAWQSAGKTPDPWLGPSILEVLPNLAARGITDVVVCPQGFVADHLEVLYDVDIQAKAAAAEVGITLTRTPSPNDDAHFCEALAEVARSAVA
jgi:ferrochelatase